MRGIVPWHRVPESFRVLVAPRLPTHIIPAVHLNPQLRRCLRWRSSPSQQGNKHRNASSSSHREEPSSDTLSGGRWRAVTYMRGSDRQTNATPDCHSVITVEFARPGFWGWATNIYEACRIGRWFSMTGVFHPLKSPSRARTIPPWHRGILLLRQLTPCHIRIQTSL